MDYKSTEIGFSATLRNAPSYAEGQAQIGFTASLSKGFGDTAREPCIGFGAKLREVFHDPQMQLDFDAPAAKEKAGTPAPAF